MTSSLDGEIRDGCHHMRVRVYFEDTDSGQIVYHANFLRFMERGRTNFLRLLGMNQQELLKEAREDAPGFAFVVRSMGIDFLKPAILDDLLEVVTVPEEVKGASITLLQECKRGDDLLVTARVRLAFISGGKAQRIPKSPRIAMKGDS
ncbi:YbgC/FadM family acyl-CoA thioesterase (plasmid) [Nitrobacteraceae bacterium UC4446_H13]